jgi:hypothetical protein
MTPRHSPRADAQRRLRDAALFAPPSPPFALPPAPTKLEQTSPTLTDEVRALYEETPMPVAEIARLAGVAERTLYRYVARGGWTRRYPVRGVEAAAANRGRKREPRPPQPKGAGGRFIPRAEWGKPHPSGLKALDPQGAAIAAAECRRWGALAGEAMARAISFNDAERHARILALLVRVARDLAAITDGPEEPKPKPRRRRPYQWRPMLVSWPR